MTPIEACQEMNTEKIKEAQIKSIVKFNMKHANKAGEDLFNVGNAVLIKEDVNYKKGKAKFSRKGQVGKVLANNSYS